MTSSKISISVKYDLGGRIKNYNRLLNLLTPLGFKKKIESLSIYNFSYLKRVESTLESDKKDTVITGDCTWTLTYSIDEFGIFTILCESSDIECTLDNFSHQLLQIYDLFVDEKNKDYILYLKDKGQIKKGLKDKTVDTADLTFNFRETIDYYRSFLKKNDLIDPRDETYFFHDFRTIFQIPREFMDSPDISNLLALEVSDYHPEAKKEIDLFGCGYSNTWCFITERDSDFFSNGLFHLAHNCWYLSQIWLYTLSDDLGKATVKLNNFSGDTRPIKRMLLKVQKNKSKIQRDLQVIENADLVLKSSKYNMRLRSLFDSLNIKPQISIIKNQIEDMSTLLGEGHSFLQSESNENLEKNSKILEILFALNTIAGIGLFLPGLYSNGVASSFKLDFPRLASLCIILLSVIIYIVVYIRNSKVK